MKETRADTNRALMQALGLHVVLFAMMFAGLQWTRSNVAEAAYGEVIEADLVDPSALSAAMRSAMQRTPEAVPAEQPPRPLPPVEERVAEAPMPQPLPEPLVEERAPPAPVPVPDTIDQDRVQRDAVSREVARVEREQEAKRRQQEQVDLDAKKLADAERLKQQQLAELRRQRELAARERTQAEMKAQQLADARAAAADAAQARVAASRPAGNPQGRPNQTAAYQAALMNAILRQWTRPESVQVGQVCQVQIRQIPGGEVVDVQVSPSCPYDELGRRSVEAAILKASPLPYAGFEEAFERNLNLRFRAEDR